MSDDEGTREPIQPFSAVLTYKTYGYPTTLDPYKFAATPQTIGDLMNMGLPGEAVHTVTFEKGTLTVELR